MLFGSGGYCTQVGRKKDSATIRLRALIGAIPGVVMCLKFQPYSHEESCGYLYFSSGSNFFLIFRYLDLPFSSLLKPSNRTSFSALVMGCISDVGFLPSVAPLIWSS